MRRRRVTGVVGAGHQDVGGPQQPGPVIGEGGRAPLAGRRERHRLGEGPARRPVVLVADGQQAGVGVVVGGGERGQGAGGGAGQVVVEVLDVAEHQLALGEGAGLVEADHVDAGQALDGGQLLGEDLLAGQPGGAHREGDAGEQHQALGHHGHQPGHRGLHRVDEAEVGADLRGDQQDGGGYQQPAHPLDDAVDAVTQLGAHQREAPGVRAEPEGVRVGADLGGPHAAAARGHEAARHHVVAGHLVDRVGLPGEQGLVDLEAHRVEHLPVDADLVAGAQHHQVVGHQLLDPDLLLGAVAHHAGPGSVEHRQPVEGALGPDLLDDADGGVEDQHDAEQRILELAYRQDDHQQGAQQEVERGEDVGLDDLADGATGGVGDVVGATVGPALVDLGPGEPGGEAEVGHRRGPVDVLARVMGGRARPPPGWASGAGGPGWRRRPAGGGGRRGRGSRRRWPPPGPRRRCG